MIGIISFILALGIIILVHELGHFLVAKHYGILCHEFSIGMGPTVWSKKKGETTYSIRAIPFGGFVAMAGEEAEKEMVKLLKGFLRYDDEGNERIYAPSLIAVKNGKILEFDDTRYWNNKKYDSAEEFWQSADLKPMKEKITKMINEVNEKSACTADCD